MAADGAEKERAHARKHEKAAEAYRLEEQKKAENHLEKVQYKQEAHDRAMENAHMPKATHDDKAGLPTEGNPYVQAPVNTSPTSVSHTHKFPTEGTEGNPYVQHPVATSTKTLNNEQNAAFPEDQPHQGTKSVVATDHQPEFAEDQPTQGTKTVFPPGQTPQQTNASRFE